MYQRGRLQSLAGLFVGQLRGGELAQLVVDQWKELLGGLGVAVFDGGQELGEVGHAVWLYTTGKRGATGNWARGRG